MPGQSPLSMMQPMEQRARKAAGRRSRRRHWPILLPVAIVVLGVVWVGLWYYAASIADRTLAGWVEREAAAGRVYSCDSQSIGGFPLRIEARCAGPGAEIKSNQPSFAVKASAVSFTAEVWHPTRLIGDIVGPLALAELGQPPSLAADWSRAQLIVRGVPPDPESVSIQLDGSHLDRIGSAGGNQTIFKAAQADLEGRIIAGSPRHHPVIEVLAHLSGAMAPTLHPLLGEPVEAESVAVLRGLNDLLPKPLAERFREMQAADGGIEIKTLRVTQGNVIVVGAGALKLNANGKLDGLVRVAIVGLEHLVPLLGVDRLINQGIDRLAGSDGTAAQATSALDRLIPGLGGAVRESANASLIENLKKMGEPSSIDKQPAVVLPLRFVDGSIYLGMLRVGEVPPLF
jgi:hypothetical protein